MELCRLKIDDASAARRVLMSAFRGDPYVAWIAAGREATVVPAAFELSIRAQIAHGCCFGLRLDRELCGVALIQPPAAALGYRELERAGLWRLVRAAGLVSVTRLLRSFVALERFKSKLLLGQRHLYLDTLGMHEAHARRGLGSRLLSAALSALETHYPLPCLVLTHLEHNVRFYRGPGFEPLARYRLAPARLDFHALVRPHRAANVHSVSEPVSTPANNGVDK